MPPTPKKMKKPIKYKIVTLFLEGSNGFIHKRKWNPTERPPMVVKIPFLYQMRLTDPTIGLDEWLRPEAVGEFHFTRATKTKAYYRLGRFDFIRTK